MKKVSIDKASYEGYAVLKGGEVIKLFNDNSDLVTDRDSNAFPVEVSIGGKKKTIDFIRRGRNCDLQRNLLKKIGENITVSANIDHKDKVVFGDGVLVYPGKAVKIDGPVSGLRLEAVANGIEDYAYLCMAEELLGEAYVRRTIAKVTRDLTHYTLSEAQFARVRVALGNAIEKTAKG